MRHLCIRQLFVNFAQLACAAHRHALLRAIAGTAPINTHLKQMRKYGHILTYTFISILTAGIVGCGGGEQSQKELDALMNANEQTVHHSRQECLNDPLHYRNAPKPTRANTDGILIPGGQRNHDRIHVNDLGPLAEVFNDSNKYQYAWAERLGIEPITDLQSAFRTRRPLRLIKDCDAYGVDELTHSVPYLVPEAADLLERIGYNFIDSLKARGADGYKIKVTSLLRTPSTVKSLRKVNKNATDSSTHQFGTTFDISWSKFICADETRTIHEGDLKNLLAEVLYDLRRRGRCLVKFERKTACFHITVTTPDKK